MSSTPGNFALSISRSDAKIYISRPLGGAKNPDAIAMSEEALLRGFNDWQATKDGWEFLLKDNLNSFTVESCATTSGLPTISAPVASAFDGVNIGITVTGSGIPASTTISDYTRSTDGSISSITLSANATASASVTLTFGGTIPLLAGVSDYNLPTDFHKHYGVRLTGTLKWPLTFVRPRDWNRVTLDQTIQGPIELYTIFNATSPLSQNKGIYRLRVYRVPAKTDTLRVEYYRKFNSLADPIDMDSLYLYKFLDYCRGILISTKRSFDEPDLFKALITDSMQSAKIADEQVTEDQDVYMKSQMEMGGLIRPTWSNGPFFSDYGY
jgi:hypothetical protein